MSKRYAPMGKQVDEVFAQSEKKDDARKTKRDEWAKSCESLVRNPVFREWFTRIMLEHGGIEFDRPMTDIAQGQYIMLAKLRDSLKSALSAPELFGEIMKRHYELMRNC